MDVALPEDLTGFVSGKIASGQFSSVDEVAIAALRYYRDAEADDLQRLRDSLKEAREQIARGEGIVISNSQELTQYFEDVKRRGMERLAEGRGQTCSD